ncbi:MAG: ABC transporter substrate-binding protein [Alphaproteobacteria bacterium]|nr:ABC transporter substrate-binding protein [Alphaproteobacteria bacterium]
MRFITALAAITLVAASGIAAAQAPKRGGTFNFAITAETPTYDCHATDTFAAIHFLAPFYSTLLAFDLDAFPKVKGDLAESWQVSADQLTYTFKLRPGVVFHDGSPLTSADVKATYERLRKPASGVVSVRQATFADITTIETPDPATVVFKLKDVNAAMLEHFASPWNCIYSAVKLAEDPTFPSKTVLGSGPFRFVEHVRGSHVSGTRFDRYFKPGLPLLDGFKGTFMLQPAAMINALQGGQVLAEFRTVSPAERDRLKQALGDRIRTEERSWTLNLMVVFNTEKKPFDDVRVRQALTMAIDRWGGSQGLSRTTVMREVGGVVRPGAPYAIDPKELEKFPGYARDMRAARAEAQRLLREAGVPNLSFGLLNRTIAQPYTPAGIFLVDAWRQIGVTAEHKQLETSPYLAALGGGNFDVAIDFSNLFMDEPSLGLSKYLSFDKSPENRSRAIDRELDSLFERQIRERDETARRAIIRQFEARALTQAYQVPLLWWHRIVATHTAVRGWRMSPSHNLGQDLAEIWLDQ